MKPMSVRLALFSILFAATGALTAIAASDEVTVTGEAKCAKCAMGQGESCQTVIEVMNDGKSEIYYLASNDVAAGFHKNVCQTPAKATAKGTVTTKDGKKVLTATQIALVE